MLWCAMVWWLAVGPYGVLVVVHCGSTATRLAAHSQPDPAAQAFKQLLNDNSQSPPMWVKLRVKPLGQCQHGMHMYTYTVILSVIGQRHMSCLDTITECQGLIQSSPGQAVSTRHSLMVTAGLAMPCTTDA